MGKVLKAEAIFANLFSELKKQSNPEKAKFFPRFFKAGPGEYAEGDQFLGVTVPIQRQIAKQFTKDTNLEVVKLCLESPWHEVRLTGLFLLIQLYNLKTSNPSQKKDIVAFYLKNTKYINNWDLVDSSADKILGDYFFDKDRSPIYKLSKSKDLWENRIAVLSTFAFIRKGDFKDCIHFSEMYLTHPHDLIHKATGWMLREIGKRNPKELLNFLDSHNKKMPRTMLRYAIEKLPEKERKFWLTHST